VHLCKLNLLLYFGVLYFLACLRLCLLRLFGLIVCLYLCMLWLFEFVVNIFIDFVCFGRAVLLVIRIVDLLYVYCIFSILCVGVGGLKVEDWVGGDASFDSLEFSKYIYVCVLCLLRFLLKYLH
jgi:hypothetical protein